MNFHIEQILLAIAILLFLSILASKASFRYGVPTLILFLGIGMLAGSEGIGKIKFDSPFITQLIGVIALNFILFSGGLETQWVNVRPILKRGIMLSTAGVLITAASVGLFVHWITDLSLTEGFLLGAIVSSTDAAAVFSVLRSNNIGLKRNLRPTLELESGSNDPVAYFLTITLTALVVSKDVSAGQLVWQFAKQMALGALMGGLLGYVNIRILNRIRLHFEGLYPVLALALMFFAFSFTDYIGGNGFLAVYLSAIILGNADFTHKKSLIRFYDGQAWLMQIILFITLGLLVYPSRIIPLVGTGLLISFFLMFAARPLGVFLSLLPFQMSRREKLFLSWVGLRGAVPIVFATYPLLAGIDKAGMIFNLVFFISASSVLVQGATLKSVGKWLKLTVPEKAKRRFAIDIELSEEDKSVMQQVIVSEDGTTAGKRILDMRLPKGVLIVMINRQGKYITPRGSTVIEAMDELMLIANDQNEMRKAVELIAPDGF